ncbi:MAG: aminopeptidase N [Wenzhouxiangellaceae bacterium]
MDASQEPVRKAIKRSDYRPPAWRIPETQLRFELDPAETRVHARLTVEAVAPGSAGTPLVLDGVGLETELVAIDGQALDASRWRVEGERLIIEQVPEGFELSTVVRIHPERNTALEGLYRSGQMLLTQCEAEGFRKITWFLDRPDVMSVYRVRLEADASRFPVLLSNGNPVAAGTLDGGRHFSEWFDPFPKPAYLFAIAAGDLCTLEDEYLTASGRRVQLRIHSDRRHLHQLEHAMASLKRAMRWDEHRFGLECDLDVYQIVATPDFNMGAMENKGLNIFNTRYVLADPETATDDDFIAVESVIGHEYFHNWTGNRVTCRDWFQLTLKEGLTVFRDQEFTADHHSAPLKRIEDVRDLMARQWPEDAGPMAHPIRPEQYLEINNFYTATVYEKGAEVVRMYQTLLGREGFARGLKCYLERHDGQAVTCDDFRIAMADANGVDLGQFERWYRQVGTPTVTVQTRHDPASGEFRIRFAQRLPEHPANEGLGPLHIPIRLGLLDRKGRALAAVFEADGEPANDHLFELREPQAELVLRGLHQAPVLSVLRDFSAPVRVETDHGDDDLALLAGHDPDPVARWLAMRRLMFRVLGAMVSGHADPAGTAQPLLRAWQDALRGDDSDPALVAELLRLPSETELCGTLDRVDVDAVHEAREQLLATLVDSLADTLLERYRLQAPDGPWRYESAQMARRRLANQCLALLVSAGNTRGIELAVSRYREADNMTDRGAALAMLVHAGREPADELLGDFARRHADDALVMDKWFAIQATAPHLHTVEQVAVLKTHPAFSMRNPNKVRSLLGAFALSNPYAFHRADGEGYRLIGAAVRELDAINPQAAARLVSAFNRWRAFDERRQQMMRAELERILARPGLSPDVEEIVRAALGEGR